VEALSNLTGLSADYISQNQWRIEPQRFTAELLRRERQTIGLMDSRVTAVNVAPGDEYPLYDPSFALVKGPYVAAFNDYLARELNYATDEPYLFLSMKANESWKWDLEHQGYLDVTNTLARAMSANDRMKVFFAAGYYDLTTPYLSQRYTVDHLNLNQKLRDNITFACYPAGHQLYTFTPALSQLKADIAAFVESASRPPQ
jgi:carboxypeptidase C (cathepsin A)